MYLVFKAFLIALQLLLIWASPSLASTGAAIALTKRSNLSKRDSHIVNATKVRAAHSRIVGKFHSGLKTYERNVGSPHPLSEGIKASLEKKRQQDTIDPLEVPLWVGNIGVGNPVQNLVVEFDTASTDVFLRTSGCCGGSSWNPSASTTAINTTNMFEIFLPTQEIVEGFVFTDSFSVAGLSVPKQVIGAATVFEFGTNVANFSTDGVVGLAYQSLSQIGEFSLLTNMENQGVINPIFGIGLGGGGTAAELFLGGVNPSLFVGTILNSSLVDGGDPSFWELRIGAVSVLEPPSTFTPGDSIAFIDTFSPFIVGDTQTISLLHEAIPGALDASDSLGPGYFTVPCDTNSIISIQLGNDPIDITIPFENWNLGPVDSEGTICASGFIADDLGAWVIGEPLFQSVYTVFDMLLNTVGFAELR